jgi:hypothetical protein
MGRRKRIANEDVIEKIFGATIPTRTGTINLSKFFGLEDIGLSNDTWDGDVDTADVADDRTDDGADDRTDDGADDRTDADDANGAGDADGAGDDADDADGDQPA